MVDLTGENRILAKLGLNRIAGTDNNGLLALAEANALDLNHITSYHIGFVLGPCLNAGGRLETAKLSFGLFYEKDPSRAAETAKRLKELNDKRKEYTEEGVEFALQECEKYGEDKILVLYLPQVHESIAGIIAGRVREKLWKPVIILTRAEEGVKGSARSIEGCNIFEELTGLPGTARPVWRTRDGGRTFSERREYRKTPNDAESQNGIDRRGSDSKSLD